MASESPTSPQLSHGSCRSSEGRMTACPPDQRRPLRRVSDEEVSLAQHVGHDTAVDDRLSWRAADLGAALERPCTQKCYRPTIDDDYETVPKLSIRTVTFQRPWTTLYLDFKVTPLFHAEMWKCVNNFRHTFNTILGLIGLILVHFLLNIAE